MNNITITGRLTADPELKTTQSGISVCAYNLAVKRPKVKDTTDFLTVVSWRQGAEYISKYGQKGDMVAVSGVLTTRSWEDKNGNKRISYEIVADTVELVGGTKNEQNATKPADNISQLKPYTPNNQANQQEFITIIADEELPF
jgi:single-strand DNA-binding protein